MFSIETSEDVRILKELTSSSNDIRIRELEDRVNELCQTNIELREITKKQTKIIKDLNSKLITADDCRSIIFDLMTNKSKPQNLSKEKKVSVIKSDTDEFTFVESMQKKFNKILIEGNTLIHHTIRNQKMKLPISTLELLALMEVYQLRNRKLLNKDAVNICKLYDITKAQFGKIYYNILEGVFFEAIEEIDKQIKRTVFKIEDNFIYIVDGGKSINTNIDVNTFKNLCSIYVNSSQPYSTIYKLSKENKSINPIYLLAILRRNSVISSKI